MPTNETRTPRNKTGYESNDARNAYDERRTATTQKKDGSYGSNDILINKYLNNISLYVYYG
jgi:hypothetical protein